MSGVAGGNRIDKGDVKDTFERYTKEILEKIPGFKKATLSGSVKVGSKPDYGDLDLITWFEGEDKKEVKQRIIQVVTSLPDSVIVPFKSEKYTGKKYYNAGEMISVLYPIVGKQDQYIQVDNIIALSEEEHGFKNSFLDLPAEIQGLIIGLAKVILLEEDKEQVFKRLGIKNLPPLQDNEEYEFNLSSVKLSLRKVKLDNFREVGREELWSTTDWNLISKLFINFDIDSTFEVLLKDIKGKIKNARSRNRIKGIFNSMVSIKSGEVGTPKAAGKQKALDDVNTLLENRQDNVALYAGGFKPPHSAHFNNAEFLAKKADKLIIFIGPKIREGVRITAEQSKDIWEIYAKYLPIPVEIRISQVTPVRDIYEFVDENQQNYNLITTGALPEEMSKFSYFEKNREKYPRVEVVELPRIGDEDNKFSATSVRTSISYLKSGTWVPEVIADTDKKQVLNIVTKNTPTEKEILMQEALNKTLDEIFNFNQSNEAYELDIPKFNYKKSLPQILSETLYEIKLSKENAVEINGDLTGGTFKVGDIVYEYSIKNIPNPYKDLGRFYNIQFTPYGETISTPTQDTSPKNYIKILSTMYKILSDFAEKERPEYIGISSLNNSKSKNYHLVYSALTNPKNNYLPDYFRKDNKLVFNTTSQGSGRFVVLKRKNQTDNSNTELTNEGSSGTPIRPHSIVRSSDRAKLVRVYTQLLNVIGDAYYDITFNQDHIQIKVKDKDSSSNFDYTPYMASILEYMIDKGEKITPLPEIKLRKDIVESADFFGKTAFYNPSDKEITLYTLGRHPKDVMRSFAHEMIHHKQNLEGKLKNIQTDNTNQDDYLLEIEKQAYLEGNILFRNWEDSVKN